MKCKKSKTLFLFFVFLPSLIFCQEKIRLKKLDLRDGLSQSSVHEILQDREGFMWFGTQDGLNKYDGYQFTIYRPSPKNPLSICNNWINDIVEDADGNIWVGTNHGLCKWNRTTNDFTNFLPETRKDFIGERIHKLLYTSESNKLWFIHDRGISFYDFNSNSFTHCWKSDNMFNKYEIFNDLYLLADKEGKIWATTTDSGVVVINNKLESIHINDKLENTFSQNHIWHAMIGIDGEIWLSTNKGLMHYNSQRQKFSVISDKKDAQYKLPAAIATSALFDNDNNLWIVLSGYGIVRIDSKTSEIKSFQLTKELKGFVSNTFHASYKDNMGRLWFYQYNRGNGIAIYNPKTQKFINYKIGEDAYSLNGSPGSFFAGKDGEIWIGSDDGINIYNPRLENFTHVSHIPSSDSSLNQASAWSMIKDKKGRTWVCTQTALNMKESDNKGFIHFMFNSSNANGFEGAVNRLFEDKKGRIWAAANNGIFLFDEKNKKFKKIPIHLTVDINTISVTVTYENLNQELCIACNGSRVAKLNEQKMIFEEFEYNRFIENKTLNVIIELKNDKKFYGTWEGFYLVDNKSNTNNYYEYHYGDNTSLSNTEVNDALVQNDSIIWIATANGLNRFNHETGTFKYYFIEDGLPNQYIYQLVEDKYKNIWMSTNNGISMFNPLTEIFKNYDINDGLQSNEFNSNAAFSNGDEILFGGINGYNQFKPSKLKLNQTPSRLYFIDLYVNNKKIIPSENSEILKTRLEDVKVVNLNEGIASVSVDFVALDFTTSNELQYYYQLQKDGGNNSDEWFLLNNQRSINISNPEFGNYVLKIKAKNKDDIDSNIKILEINILPPFYKTTWFKFILAVLLIICIYSFYRMRLKAIQKQKRELEKQVKERTHEVVEQRDEAEKQKKIAIQQKEEVAIQKEIIEIKNKEIIDSILYAKRIQNALLKGEAEDIKHLPPHFILFKPKDIVSGDFYWTLEKQDYLYVAAVDCTGHGVPGAFMSMLGIAYLNDINAEKEILSPASIMEKLRTKIVGNLSGEKSENKDGMDMSLYKLNLKTNELEWAGSNNPLWIVTHKPENYSSLLTTLNSKASVFKQSPSDTKIILEIKPDKQSIGYNEDVKPFVNHTIQLHKNDSIYIFTDGFADQFGGEKGKKFKYKSLKQLTLEVENLPMEEQKTRMNEVFEKWRGKLEQIDDVCLIGLKL